MACLFCGKEIGPIRQLRDREFCSPKHRKEYKDRLQKVLVRVGEPETIPAGMAPFQDPIRPEPGNLEKSVAATVFHSAENQLRLPASWPLSIPEVRGRVFARLALTAQDISGAPAARAWDIEPLPYFGDRDAARLLSAPSGQLGAVALRSIDGHVLSGPQARDREASAGTSAALSLATLSLPALALSAASCDELTNPAVSKARGESPEPAASDEVRECASWMAGSAAQPLARLVEPSFAQPIFVPLAQCLPELVLAIAPEELLSADSVEPEPQSIHENWIPGGVPGLAAREVQPVSIEPLRGLISVQLPESIVSPALTAQPELHSDSFGFALNPARRDVKVFVPAAAFIGRQQGAPDLASLAIANPGLPAVRQNWMPIPESEPAVCEVRPRAANTPVPFAAASLKLAPLSLQPVQDALPVPQLATPAAQSNPAAASIPPLSTAPQAPSWNPVEAIPAAVRSSEPVSGVPVIQFPKLVATQKLAQPPAGGFDSDSLETVPYGDLLTVEYASQRGPESPLARLEWIARPLSVQPPRFAVRPVFDRLEDLSRRTKEPKRPAFAEIFTMPDAAALTQRKAARHAITAIAASVTVAMALWFGASAGKLGKSLIARTAAEEMARTSVPDSDTIASASRPARPTPNALTSPVAWVRSEAAKRAAVEVADSFDKGMQAWGAKNHQMAAGWTRNSDGYVRPGQLALFQPTLNYTDYRLEFFGEIENKSMSWVVRGKDARNYYAMKFNVVQPGLRPVISMVHYPVVDGKQGKKVEMPLSIMVHNSTPYHVAVQVKGAHFTASIEGQEVDEWTDDSLMAGGVGFFSEAGARARLYWMKVYKNDDWFGRICGYLAGGDASAAETAWLERPQLPTRAPERPAPAPSTAPVWTVETAGMQWQEYERGRTSSKGDIERWSS